MDDEKRDGQKPLDWSARENVSIEHSQGYKIELVASALHEM